jgi:hypothetical protein
MYKKPITAGIVLVALLALGRATDADRQTPVLSPAIPPDVMVTHVPPTLDSLQADFDRFSWQSFVALNWPAKPDGTAGPTTPIGSTDNGDNPTVWENWKNAADVFRPGGAAPTAWGAPPIVPAACHIPGAPAGARVLTEIAKVPSQLFSAFEQVFTTGPLIDRNGAFVRYEIMINRPMYDYIARNTLYSRAGQQVFSGPLDFPQGHIATNAVGAIMVKAAWKPLGAGDDPTRFHTARALVYTPPSNNPKIAESCTLQTMGLVGLHIVHRTTTAPQWIWTTFEQADNAPDFGATKPAARRFSFYDPANQAPINTPPPRPWNPNQPSKPTQLMRLTPLTSLTQTLNARWQAQLAAGHRHSVWQYYQLIGTQWPTDPGHPQANPLGTPQPSFLANTTIESYIQGIIQDGKVTLVPNATSSCAGCHNNATMVTGKPASFTYLLSRAE